MRANSRARTCKRILGDGRGCMSPATVVTPGDFLPTLFSPQAILGGRCLPPVPGGGGVTPSHNQWAQRRYGCLGRKESNLAGLASGGPGSASRGDRATCPRLPILPRRDPGSTKQRGCRRTVLRTLNKDAASKPRAQRVPAPCSGVANWELEGQFGPRACPWGPRRVGKRVRSLPGGERTSPIPPAAPTATSGCLVGQRDRAGY